MDSFLLLLPDFLLIVAGAVLRRKFIVAEGFWTGVEKLVYFVLFPAMLFRALAGTHLDPGAVAPQALAGLLTMLAGLGLGMAARPWMGLSELGCASRLQCAYRFNTYIGMAIAGQVYGAPGLAAMGALCGMMVPFANIMAVGMLARHGQGNWLRELSRNPLVLATVAGFLYQGGGFGVPAPVDHFLARLGQAAVTLGLLAVGAALRFERAEGRVLPMLWLAAVKLVALPATALGLGALFGLNGLALGTLLLFAALPSASSAYILAMRMGGDGPGVAWLITATTVLAVPGLSFWLSWLPQP